MERPKNWDYRFLSVLLAGVLGIGAELTTPELKQIFCSVRANYAVNAPTVLPTESK
jgi:hypothetical protein